MRHPSESDSERY